MDYDIFSFPVERRIVVDAGYLGSKRHIIYGLVEVDVTRARQLLREHSERLANKLSFTAFLVASLARAIGTNPNVQAYQDWRGRLVVFHEVDVVTMIEPRAGAVAVPHIIRAANRKTVYQISAEIRSVQAQPVSSAQRGGLMNIAPHLPRFTRLLFFWAQKKNPHWFKQLSGTVVITSVGMFGRGGGWGISFLPIHNLGLTVGGITQKPGVHNGEIAIREYLHLTISFNHDVVDGAPAARFTQSLVELIESASVLQEEPLPSDEK
jgi:pyruvate/2-oxoglutarate dehydrogenase complex dihydrolipoamide acyltransferase (E2) component